LRLKPKIIGYISVGVGIAIMFGVYTSIDSAEKNHQSIFHVTLADPTMYQNGVFTDSFEIQEGSYYFAFVPNGDSPHTIAKPHGGILINRITKKYPSGLFSIIIINDLANLCLCC